MEKTNRLILHAGTRVRQQQSEFDFLVLFWTFSLFDITVAICMSELIKLLLCHFTGEPGCRTAVEADRTVSCADDIRPRTLPRL